MTSQKRLAITDNLIFLYSIPLRWRDTMQCPRVVEEWGLLAIKMLSELDATANPRLKFIEVKKIFWASYINEYLYRFSFNFSIYGLTRETNWEVKSRRSKQGLTVVGSSRRMRSTDATEMPFLFTIFANWVSGWASGSVVSLVSTKETFLSGNSGYSSLLIAHGYTFVSFFGPNSRYRSS